MFHKLRQAKYLKARSNANSVSVGFFGQVASLARVHQYGLRDRVRPGGPQIHYEQRQLLGFTKEDEAMIEEVLVEHLST
jgi:phage virion morphogenesis protein